MIEHGRPLRCSIIHGPTLSKYLARSSLVIEPSPSSGQSILSGRLRSTPITTPALEEAAASCRLLPMTAGSRLGDLGLC